MLLDLFLSKLAQVESRFALSLALSLFFFKLFKELLCVIQTYSVICGGTVEHVPLFKLLIVFCLPVLHTLDVDDTNQCANKDGDHADLPS